ncbi:MULTISPECIES: hypothetical protein [unclassified Streptomyces]|uniref:hypothetical protein n=1 Tax=unclassified Streptomyces TaxID=2593676 RepID=UPI0022718B0D|nr:MULTISPECIES: hypothetical protein [unclassified Streptomyces]MCY0924112.1 hypothetical protein [Streptomyces sp. H27-G5]MCY0963153.1 hypothetical protein [Streptomyces sp. H27-H5]
MHTDMPAAQVPVRPDDPNQVLYGQESGGLRASDRLGSPDIEVKCDREEVTLHTDDEVGIHDPRGELLGTDVVEQEDERRCRLGGSCECALGIRMCLAVGPAVVQTAADTPVTSFHTVKRSFISSR